MTRLVLLTDSGPCAWNAPLLTSMQPLQIVLIHLLDHVRLRLTLFRLLPVPDVSPGTPPPVLPVLLAAAMSTLQNVSSTQQMDEPLFHLLECSLPTATPLTPGRRIHPNVPERHLLVTRLQARPLTCHHDQNWQGRGPGTWPPLRDSPVTL